MSNNSETDWCHPETFLYSAKYRRRAINRVGEGANGQVFVGCTRKTCYTKYAIKKSRSDMRDEYDTLKRAYRADPRHVPKPYHFVRCKTTNNNLSNNTNRNGSIMYYEYIPSVTLSKYKKVSMKMLFEILMTVYKLNKAGIKHGDLHLANILIKKGTNRPYITDFDAQEAVTEVQNSIIICC
jgi:predicted Ser/Thr protein kinase